MWGYSYNPSWGGADDNIEFKVKVSLGGLYQKQKKQTKKQGSKQANSITKVVLYSQTEGLLQIQGQLGLQEFQASQNYKVRPCVKTKTKQSDKQTKMNKQKPS